MKSLISDLTTAADRPYERCLRFGAKSLSDAELLAVIIRTGTRGMDSVSLAEEILKLPKGREGLSGITSLTIPEYMTLPGIGEVKAIQLSCIAELSKRIASSGAKHLIKINDPSSIADYYMETLRYDDQENVICMMLDTKHQMIGDERITRGTCNASILSARDVFLCAMKFRAVRIVLIHNHPSGDPSPSENDLLLTRKIFEAGMLLDIPLIDHVIIGDRCFFSFAENDLIINGSTNDR